MINRHTAYAKATCNRGPNTTLLSSTSVKGRGLSLAVEGSMNREAFKALPRAGSSSRSASRTDRDDGQLEHTKQSESKRPKRSEGVSSYTFPTRRISVLSKRPSRRSKGSGAKLRLVVGRLWWRR
jgi:hypothetical protein